MDLSHIDFNAPFVYLDQRNQSPHPFDVVLWDQRTGAVQLLLLATYVDRDGNPHESPETVLTHADALLVNASNVPDALAVPTVAELLEREAFVIVRRDGSVFRRHEAKKDQPPGANP